MVRNGGTHGDVSVDWLLTRNSTDPSPVTVDISPSSGTLRFAQGQMLAPILLTVVDDGLSEEAEVFLLKILPPTAQGGAEVSEPAQVGPLSCFTPAFLSLVWQTSATAFKLPDAMLALCGRKKAGFTKVAVTFLHHLNFF